MLNTAAPYRILKIEPNTPRWVDWRFEGIGSSDAAAIMGESKFKSPEDVFLDKCGLKKDEPLTEPMRIGIELEPKARVEYEEFTGIRVSPACLQSNRYEWQLASVDGLANDGQTVVEIKCGRASYWSTVRTQAVPAYYVGQLQHILAVTGLPAIDFWCYWPGHDPIHLEVGRDERYISRLTDAEWALWRRVHEYRKQKVQRSDVTEKPKISLRIPIVSAEPRKFANAPKSREATARVEAGATRRTTQVLRVEPSPPLSPQGRCLECGNNGDVYDYDALTYCKACCKAKELGWERGPCHRCRNDALLKRSMVYSYCHRCFRTATGGAPW